MKPEFSKPFNANHARAGALYCCRDGTEATVLKWDGRGKYPIIGVASDIDKQAIWMQDGHILDNANRDYDLVMLPLGMVDGRPVFMGDIVEHRVQGIWYPITAAPNLRNPWNVASLRWPAPEKVYQVTGMSRHQMEAAYIKEISGKPSHSSDCATSSSPAETPRRYDCDAPQAVAVPAVTDMVHYWMNRATLAESKLVAKSFSAPIQASARPSPVCREAVAWAICFACDENPGDVGDAQYNEFRWQDYLSAADAAIAACNADKRQKTAPVVLIDEQISKGARYMSDRSAEVCCVDKDDNWKVYGQNFIDEFRAAVTAATGSGAA